MYKKEAHHWNYNLPDCVFIMTRKAHALLHNYLVYDESLKIFHVNGYYLDTKEKHYDFIVKTLRENNVKCRIDYFETLNK